MSATIRIAYDKDAAEKLGDFEAMAGRFPEAAAHFARAVEESGFTFIGPPPEAIEMMGDKSAARQAAELVGVPIVPGTPEPVTMQQAPAEAERIGFPVVVKAAFGGGGRARGTCPRRDRRVDRPRRRPSRSRAARVP